MYEVRIFHTRDDYDLQTPIFTHTHFQDFNSAKEFGQGFITEGYPLVQVQSDDLSEYELLQLTDYNC